jgi:hypothetical protein
MTSWAAAMFTIDDQNNHNILQGVAAPTLRLTEEQRKVFDAWIQKVKAIITPDASYLITARLERCKVVGRRGPTRCWRCRRRFYW